MKKFSLLRYLDPYDNYDSVDDLDVGEQSRVKSKKNSELFNNADAKLNELLTLLASIEAFMKSENYVAKFAFSGDDGKKEQQQLRRIIKRVRDKAMQLHKKTSEVASKNYEKNKK